MKTILLSEHLHIERKALEKLGVFDVVLGIDTKVFIDPKLLVKSKVPELKNSRKRMLQYFAVLFQLLRRAKSPRIFEEAVQRLAVEELRSLSIGYGGTDRGQAISRKLATKILLAMSDVMVLGLDDEELVEVLALFIDGFGPDSISDLTASIMHAELCHFTERIAKKIGVKTTKFNVISRDFELPPHPLNSKNPIIFVPLSILSPLPVASSWEEISIAAQHNRKLRNDFGAIILPALKEQIQKIGSLDEEARGKVAEEISTVLSVYRKSSAIQYSTKQDQKGYYRLYPEAMREGSTYKNTISVGDKNSLVLAVREILVYFKRSVENNGLNKLLFHRTKTGKLLPDKPHHEDVSQLLLQHSAQQYCERAGIVLSGQSNAGLGPVDFFMATSPENKVIVEIKKSNNPNLIDGFTNQVAVYQASEAAHYSFYVVILVKDNAPKGEDLPQNVATLKKMYEQKKKDGDKVPELIIIDGKVYESPSKRH